MNTPEPDPSLAAAVHAALRELPPRRAPATLVARVLDVLRARAALPWWQRAWWQWPLSARAASAGLALLVAASVCGGSVWLGGWTGPDLSWLADESAAASGRAQEFYANLSAFVNPASWTAGWLWSAVAALIAAYLLCIGGGTLLVRLTTGSLEWSRRDRSTGGDAARTLMI